MNHDNHSHVRPTITVPRSYAHHLHLNTQSKSHSFIYQLPFFYVGFCFALWKAMWTGSLLFFLSFFITWLHAFLAAFFFFFFGIGISSVIGGWVGVDCCRILHALRVVLSMDQCMKCVDHVQNAPDPRHKREQNLSEHITWFKTNKTKKVFLFYFIFFSFFIIKEIFLLSLPTDLHRLNRPLYHRDGNWNVTAPKLLRNCSETALKLLWNCSETALKLLWKS